MKKNSKVLILITSIILLGIIVSSLFVFNSYSKVIKDSTRNVAELSTMNIYSEINNELTKPIYVSITMANDSFLKTWLEDENNNDPTEIEDYLDGIKSKYNYNSVFLVSSNTLNYYHYDGINKVVSSTNDHDIWYYQFLESTGIYELDVDVDEVSHELTIFVNVKVLDDENNVVAVVGVGLQMDYVQEIMSDFEEEYSLQVYLIDDTGLIQSNTDTSKIETVNVFNIFDNDLKETIINQQDLLITSVDKSNKYIISRYVEDINWYLVVTKDTNLLSRFFLDYFIITIAMILVVTLLVLYIVNDTLQRYQGKVYKLAKTDYLTLLLNRRGFDLEYESYIDTKEALVFIIDIDKFKAINDQYGHTNGDKVLRKLAFIINSEVSKYGKLSRWGGDEFTAVMVGNRQDLEQVLVRIYNLIPQDELLKQYNVTISLGYTYTDFTETLDKVLSKADKGLYDSKAKGGSQSTYVK